MSKKQREPGGSPVDVETGGQQNSAEQDPQTAAVESETSQDLAPRDASELQAELQDCQDRLLRSQAELENFRKRSRREMEDHAKYASLPLLNDLLAVFDNLDRAIESAEGGGESGALVEGVQMVSQQLQQVLERYQCKRIEAIGQPFDPNLHEAVQMEPSSEYAANIVSRELQVGYVLHDRVIRPSQVFVSTGTPE